MKTEKPETGKQINKEEEYRLLRREIAGIKELEGIDLTSIPDDYLELYKKLKNGTLTVGDIERYRPKVDLRALVREHPEISEKGEDKTLTVEDIKGHVAGEDWLAEAEDLDPKKNFIAFLANQMISPGRPEEK